MSKLVKLKLASMEGLARFLPSRISTVFASTEPEAQDGEPKPVGIEAVEQGLKPKAMEHGRSPKAGVNERKVSETKTSADAAPSENLGREMVTYGVESKKSEVPKAKVEEPEEILELKTPGFVRIFGCDSCEDSDTEIRHGAHNSSSEASDDDEHPRGSHQPPHLTPGVVHLRVPMKNKDDVRKVVAALQIEGVLEVACDLDNQIVKVTGNVDPDRLLKKAKKVKRKSKLLSYSNPSEMPDSNFRSDRPPPPGYTFVRPAYEERFRPPSQPHVYSRDSHGPFGAPPPHVPPPHFRPAAQPRHFGHDAFHHHHRPPPSVRPPPPHLRSPRPGAFYRDDSCFHDYIPRPPSSPPHYHSNSSFYPEHSPPSLRRSTSPPRRRSYHHAPPFRPPPMHYPGGPPSRHRSSPWGPGVPSPVDGVRQVPDRMTHMYH